MSTLTPEIIRRAPKALLHDHLDGGLRPSTVLELAGETGYDGLPATEPTTPGQVSKALLIADSETSGYFTNMRGLVL